MSSSTIIVCWDLFDIVPKALRPVGARLRTEQPLQPSVSQRISRPDALLGLNGRDVIRLHLSLVLAEAEDGEL